MPVLESLVSTCSMKDSFISSRADALAEFVSLPSHTVVLLHFKGASTAIGRSEVGKHISNRNPFDRLTAPYMHLLFATSRLVCTHCV